MEEKRGFDFHKFINDSRDVLLNPKDFFPKLELTGGYGEPIIKALLYGAVAGFFSMIWSFLHIGGAMGGMFGSTFGVSAFFVTIIGAVIGAFIVGVIFLVLSSICNGNSDFEANFRVAVAIMVIYPISTFLNVFGGLSFWLSSLIGLAVNLYALYVLYYGITLALKGKEETARVVGYVLGGLLILFMLIGAGTRQATKSFSKYGSKYFEEGLREYEKAAKKSAKEIQSAFEEAFEEMGELEEVSKQKSTDPFAKPDSYPFEAVKQAEAIFSDGEPCISRDKIIRLIDIGKDFKEIENGQEAEVLKILEINGYEGFDAYQKDFIAAIMAFEGLKSLLAMQAVIDATPAEKKAAEIYTFDQAVESMVRQTVGAAKLTPEDIKNAFDNWELLAQLSILSNK